MTSPALQIAIAFVLTFLVVLIVRYVLLLWLGYLQHIENRGLNAEDTAQPPVTIVVPVFDEEAVIEAALRSLLELRYPVFHVIVVDDGSRDRTFERASALAGRYGACTIRVLRKRNGGKASALNVGIAHATTEYVLCMDGDSRLHPDTLRFAITDMPGGLDPYHFPHDEGGSLTRTFYETLVVNPNSTVNDDCRTVRLTSFSAIRAP